MIIQTTKGKRKQIQKVRYIQDICPSPFNVSLYYFCELKQINKYIKKSGYRLQFKKKIRMGHKQTHMWFIIGPHFEQAGLKTFPEKSLRNVNLAQKLHKETVLVLLGMTSVCN